MLLTIDVGNTQLFAGLFDKDDLVFRFRKTSGVHCSSDEYGLFLIQVLRENGVDPKLVKHIVIGSVVPGVMHSLVASCIKYFAIEPLVLHSKIKTGLSIKYNSPQSVGADIIATAVASVNLFPNKNIAIFDFGTATTCAIINKKKEFLGGLIVPGLRLSMQALEQNTAKLPAVEIKVPNKIIGESTIESIQAGLYCSALGLVKEVISHLKEQYFVNDEVMIIGTGGIVKLFESVDIFDVIEQDLVLLGLKKVFELNIG